MQYSVNVRNAGLDAKFAELGPSPILKIRTGPKPATCAAANTGTVLATVTLPVAPMDAASNGSISKAGTWEDLSADDTGTAGHFRIYDSGETFCGVQGSCGTIGADMLLSSTNFTSGQTFTVLSFTVTDNNG